MVKLASNTEVLQVLVVSPNVHRMQASLKEVSPLLERLDNSKYLLVMILVVALYRVHVRGQFSFLFLVLSFISIHFISLIPLRLSNSVTFKLNTYIHSNF